MLFLQGRLILLPHSNRAADGHGARDRIVRLPKKGDQSPLADRSAFRFVAQWSRRGSRVLDWGEETDDECL